MKIGVIADDLTGANATGVQLTKQGFQATTYVYYNQEIKNEKGQVVCVDTDSRYAQKNIAHLRVQAVMNQFKKWGANIVCKRIDSTIRGNIGVELDIVLNELNNEAKFIVVPSFPDSGRGMAGGYLLVNGVPVQNTDVSKDPVNPLKESYVPDIIQEQSCHAVSHIGLKTILKGKKEITKKIQRHIENGKQIIVMDAVTNEEIEDIASAMVNIQECQILPADPGPLTAAYSRAYAKRNTKQNKVVATIGSITSHTEKQIHYLIEKTSANPIYVDTRSLASNNEMWEKEINRVLYQALEEINKQNIIIITTMTPGIEQLNLRDIAKEENQNQDYLAKRIADGLAKMTRIIVEEKRNDISGVFSSGGDVTASLCSVGNANGIKLVDEIMPLVAFGQFIGGYLNGLPLVTKGGMAGNKKAIYASIQRLLIQDINNSIN